MRDRKMKAGSACKVQRRAAPGQPPAFADGVIKETSGRGAFVRTNHDGNSSFYRWTEILFPDDDGAATPKQVAPKHFATLGDKLKPALASVVYTAPASDPPKTITLPMTPPIPAKKLEATIRMLDRNSDVPARPRNPPARPKKARNHQLTQVGAMLRAARMAHAWSQDQVAIKLGISNQRVSKIELGWPPSEDELVLFSVLFSIHLDKLTDAATQPGSLYEKQDLPAAAEAEVLLVAQEQPVAVASAITTPEAFADFVGVLDDVVEMPRDKAQRKEWLDAARVLFKLRHQ